MKLTLIYPPFVPDSRAFPPLSLPALTAFARQNGYEVEQFDFNIKFYRQLTTPESVDFLQQSILRRLAAWNSGRRDLLNLQHLCSLTDTAHAWLPAIKSELADNGWDLSKLPGAKCTRVLERLVETMALEQNNPKSVLEMSTAELLAEAAADSGSLLLRLVQEIALKAIVASKPDVLGISLMTEEQFFPALLIAHAVKELLPHVHIVCGGGFVSSVADKIGRESCDIFSLIDCFVSFDGEHALLALLQSWERNEYPRGVPNCIFLDKSSGKVEYSPPQETGSLDVLPIPDFEGLNLSEYTRSIIPYYATKGCAYGRCAYCSDPAYSSARTRDPILAASQIEILMNRYKPQTLMFVDSYIHPKYLEPLAQELIRRGVKTHWLTQTRLDRFLTTERLQIFAESGCDELWFGMETINPRMIRLIRKGSKREIIERILGDCCRNKIKVTLNCMIGFPTETEQEASDTVDFVNELNHLYPDLVFKCNAGFVFVPRIAAFGKEPEKFGITVVGEMEWSPRLEWLPPDWRYKDKYLKLEGQMFERKYQAGGDREKNVVQEIELTEETIIESQGSTNWVVDTLGLIPLWQQVFRYRQLVRDLQQQSRCSKAEALQMLQPQIAADLLWEKIGSYNNNCVYVVSDELTRAIVPLNEAYRTVLSCVGRRSAVAEIQQRLQQLYCDTPVSEVNRACNFALLYLLKQGVLDIHREESDLSSTGWQMERKNFGQQQTGTDDLPDPPEAMHPELVQIQLAGGK
jgi:anaerobic magnesium-protoporphyrin IX monomethyl ester cyclase